MTSAAEYLDAEDVASLSVDLAALQQLHDAMEAALHGPAIDFASTMGIVTRELGRRIDSMYRVLDDVSVGAK